MRQTLLEIDDYSETVESQKSKRQFLQSFLNVSRLCRRMEKSILFCIGIITESNFMHLRKKMFSWLYQKVACLDLRNKLRRCKKYPTAQMYAHPHKNIACPVKPQHVDETINNCITRGFG